MPRGAIWLFIAGVLLSCLSAGTTFYLERQIIKQAVDNRFDTLSSAISRQFSIYDEALLGVKSLFEGSEFVSRDEFRAATKHILERHHQLRAIDWVPYVREFERSVYESYAHEDGLVGYQFTRRSGGEIVKDEKRKQYFPVFYIEPLEGNRSALGFNLGSDPRRLQALLASARSAQLSVSAKIKLVQDNGADAVLHFFPVYEGGDFEPDARLPNLRGFVLGVIALDPVFQQIISTQIRGELLHFYIVDKTDEEPVVLYDSGDDKTAESSSEIGTYRRPAYAKELQIGDRVWQLNGYEPDLTSMSTYRLIFIPLSVFTAGLMVTIFISLYVRRSVIEAKDRIVEASTVVESSQHAIVMTDGDDLIELFNPAAEDLFGYTASDSIGQKVDLFLYGDVESPDTQTSVMHVPSGEFEVRACHKDGTQIPVLLSVSEIQTSRGSRYLGMVVDLSKQKEVEEYLTKAKNSAESADKAKTEFLSVISHELRTPLTVLMGYVHVLGNTENLDADMLNMVAQEMDLSCNQLLTVINDLLDISKLEAGVVEIQPIQVRIGDLFGTLEDEFKGKAQEKNLAFEVVDSDLYVSADRKRLAQILKNIIDNAFKFTDNGYVKLMAEVVDNYVQIVVSDSGKGIPDSKLALIFESMTQADSSDSRDAEGIGLGLAITKKLVDLHNGTISVDSVEGEGSVFKVILPQLKI